MWKIELTFTSTNPFEISSLQSKIMDLVQDDPKLLHDGKKVPKPNGVVVGLIPSSDKWFI